MIRSGRLHESVEVRSAAHLKEGDIFEDNEQYYKVLEIKEVRGRAYYAQVRCIDRNDKALTINYDYTDYDRVRIYYDRDFTWVFSFSAIDKSDNFSRERMIIHTFSKSEAESIFRTRCKKEYSKYDIRDVRVEMNQIK